MLKTIAFSILIIILLSENSFAQKNFTFGLPGSECYFDYIIYNPSETIKSNFPQPVIFILGAPGETAGKTFENDTLKMIPQFYYYKFVYIPNSGGPPGDKLQCFGSLVNLVKVSSNRGSPNVFLYIYDRRITRLNLKTFGVSSIFDNIQIASETALSDVEILAEDFKITFHEEEEVGSFYYAQPEKEDSLLAPTKTVAIKTYFGPPKVFDFVLSGSIRDRSTGEALPFASIMIKGTNNGTQTNADGFFTLFNVPTDTTTLEVTYIGYDKTQVFLTPAIPKQNFIIQLSSSSNLLNTVTILGAKEDVVLSKKEDVSVIKMTPKKLEQLPNLGEKDIMRSFQLMPGVGASNESSSGLYVRGGTPDQNLVLYDGFTVYQVDHLYGFYSAFNSNALKDVQLYKGGFESRFGGRLSSVTEITGKDGNQKKLNFGGDLSLLSMNLWAEVPMGEKFSSIITFRRSYKGPLYNKLFDAFNTSSTPEQTTNTTTAPSGGPGGGFSQSVKVTSYFYDLNGKFTYRPNQKDIISLSIFNGTDKLDNSIGSSDLPSFGGVTPSFSFSSTDLTKYGNFGTSLKWSRKWNEKLYGNTIISYSNYFSNRNRSQEITNSSSEVTTNNGIFENNDLSDYSIKSDYQLNFVSYAQIQFGAFATQYDIKYTYAQNDTSTVLDKKDKAILGGVYLQSKISLLNSKIQFLPGIRVSYFEETSKPYFEPRATISYSLTNKLTLKGAFGKYYQFANRVTREDLLSGSKDFWLLSDGEAIPVSSAVHYIAGVSYETNKWLFNTEIYYKNLTGLTEYSLRFNPSPNGVTYDENFYNGYGYAKGIEFLAQRKIGKINGWVSYTLGEAKNHFDVYSTEYFSANQDVTHEFKIVSLYTYKRWNFSATWVYATGRPYTAPSGAYSITLLDGTTSDYFTVTSKNALRLEDYHRLDVAANYKLLVGSKGDRKRRELGYVGVSLFNVYDRTNIWYKQFTIEDDQIVTTNVNYLGITPNLTLSLKLW